MQMKARGGVRSFGVLFMLFNAMSIVGMVSGSSTDVPNLSIPIALVGMVAGIGILMLQSWARWTTILLAGYNAGMMILPLLKSGELLARPHGSGAIVLVLALLAWNVLVLWYFLRPGVKAQFQKSSST